MNCYSIFGLTIISILIIALITYKIVEEFEDNEDLRKTTIFIIKFLISPILIIIIIIKAIKNKKSNKYYEKNYYNYDISRTNEENKNSTNYDPLYYHRGINRNISRTDEENKNSTNYNPINYNKEINENITKLILDYSKNTNRKPYINKNGYMQVYYPRSNEARQKTGYAPLHRVVAELKYNRSIEDNEVVHHIDHNKLNNQPENIEIMTKHQHLKEHNFKFYKKN